MTFKQIEDSCKNKEQELLKKYFGNIVIEAATERPETIGEYTKDLPLKIEAEYRSFLEDLLGQSISSKSSNNPPVFNNKLLHKILTENDRENIEDAYKNATEQTLWERITNTNHEDVTYYKGLLQEYTKELLILVREDFLEQIRICKSKEKPYTPQPVDTSDIQLPAELESLVEDMSRNVHDVWAATRISQGWSYGEQRNDELKKHPCIVPYDELPEDEKEYDRNTSLSTIKLIIKLGFKITQQTN